MTLIAQAYKDNDLLWIDIPVRNNESHMGRSVTIVQFWVGQRHNPLHSSLIYQVSARTFGLARNEWRR